MNDHWIPLMEEQDTRAEQEAHEAMLEYEHQVEDALRHAAALGITGDDLAILCSAAGIPVEVISKH